MAVRGQATAPAARRGQGPGASGQHRHRSTDNDMVAESAAGAAGTGGDVAHTTAAAPGQAAAYAPPDPRLRAQRALEEGRDLLTRAAEALRGGGDPAQVSETVGRASDHVASALHHLRQTVRR